MEEGKGEEDAGAEKNDGERRGNDLVRERVSIRDEIMHKETRM